MNFDSTVGSEIQKTRPALILQNDSPVTIIAAITSAADNKVYPTEVKVSPPEGGLERPSLVLLNQLRTIDKQRLVRKLGSLEAATMARVDTALRASLDLE